MNRDTVDKVICEALYAIDNDLLDVHLKEYASPERQAYMRALRKWMEATKDDPEWRKYIEKERLEWEKEDKSERDELMEYEQDI